MNCFGLLGIFQFEILVNSREGIEDNKAMLRETGVVNSQKSTEFQSLLGQLNRIPWRRQLERMSADQTSISPLQIQ